MLRLAKENVMLSRFHYRFVDNGERLPSAVALAFQDELFLGWAKFATIIGKVLGQMPRIDKGYLVKQIDRLIRHLQNIEQLASRHADREAHVQLIAEISEGSLRLSQKSVVQEGVGDLDAVREMFEHWQSQVRLLMTLTVNGFLSQEVTESTNHSVEK